MKAKAFSVSMVVAVFMIWGMSVSPLRASQYLGEVTWTYSGGGTIKGGISKTGGSYYEVQGQVAIPNGTVIFAGGGALVGGMLMLSAVSTQVETNDGGTYHNTTTMQISLNPNNYNGTVWMLTTWYLDPANPPNSVGYGNSFDTGTLTRVSGPSLAAVAPNLPLLLD